MFKYLVNIVPHIQLVHSNISKATQPFPRTLKTPFFDLGDNITFYPYWLHLWGEKVLRFRKVVADSATQAAFCCFLLLFCYTGWGLLAGRRMAEWLENVWMDIIILIIYALIQLPFLPAILPVFGIFTSFVLACLISFISSYLLVITVYSSLLE